MTSYEHGEGSRCTKKDALKAAKEIGYSQEIIDAIEKETNENEISKIMARGRKEFFSGQ